MKNIDIVNTYFKNYIQLDDNIIGNYCIAEFGLNSYEINEYGICTQECEKCWNQELEIDIDKILELFRWKYNNYKAEIKQLQHLQSIVLKGIQNICPHENIYEYSDDEYMTWNPGDEDRIIKKCKDCSKILS